MMEIKGNMMSVREDVRVLDATLRDGGLVNDFYFTDDFVYDLYKANLAAGVDYMEFGYRADKKQFDVNKFGKWKFAEDEDIRAIGDAAVIKTAIYAADGTQLSNLQKGINIIVKTLIFTLVGVVQIFAQPFAFDFSYVGYQQSEKGIPYVSKHTTEIQCVTVYGILKGKKCTYDL